MTYIETFTGTSDLVVSTNLHTSAEISVCPYRDTDCIFPMSIFYRISWWSHSCFSRTWLGNMCIPLTGWPWSWFRTGTEPQETKNPSEVCCSDLNKGLFSATAGLHINSCIHITPPTPQGFGRGSKSGIRAAMMKMTDVKNVSVWESWWCERCRSFCAVSWGLLLSRKKRQVDSESEGWGWQGETQRWKRKKEQKSRRWGRGHGSLLWIMMTDSCGPRRLGSDRVLNFQKAQESQHNSGVAHSVKLLSWSQPCLK